jgi:AcrR family transcriptional regulator
MAEKTFKAARADGVRTREAILNAAAGLATIEGLEGLSIGRLAEHIGISKSGLYAHFGSKEELQLATIDKAESIFSAFVIEPAMQAEDPVDRLEALCLRFLKHLTERVFPGGCFFVSAASELSGRPGDVRTRVKEVQEGWLAMLADQVRQGQALGLLDPTEDATQLAFELDAYLLMANMLFVMSGDSTPIERAKLALETRVARARSSKTAA